jgi:hypothetical protein
VSRRCGTRYDRDEIAGATPVFVDTKGRRTPHQLDASKHVEEGLLRMKRLFDEIV